MIVEINDMNKDLNAKYLEKYGMMRYGNVLFINEIPEDTDVDFCYI
jgi:hypothetical protein